MEKRRAFSTIIIFSVGFVAGIAVSLTIGAILSYVDPGTLLTNHPKIFGDIKIFAHKPSDVESTIDLDVDEVMYMTKAGIPFLYAPTDNTGKVTSLSLLNEKKRLVFTMTALDEPGKWGHAIYSGYDAGRRTGEMFGDINFDGHFDLKRVFDDTGKKVSSYIYIDQDWKKIDRCDFKKAIADTTTYVFDFNDGWL